MGEYVFTLDKEKSRYLRTNHNIIHYKKHQGKTDWVVFIHGAGSNHSTFKPYLTSDTSWIAFDLPGHGKSSRSRIVLDELLDDMNQLIQKETNGQVILVGNSFGCLVAEKYYYKYPQNVKKILLISPYSKNFSRCSSIISFLSKLIYSILKGKITKRRLKFTDYWKYKDRPWWFYSYMDIRGTSVTNILNTLSILFSNDIDLKNMQVPTWVLVGKRDFYCKKRAIKQDAVKNEKINLKFIDSYHYLVSSEYDKVIKIIYPVLK